MSAIRLPAAFAPTPPFDAGVFVKQIANLVKANPEIAPRVYANAALRLRYEARKPENAKCRVQLQLLAAKTDQLADEALLPHVHPDTDEEIHQFGDNAGTWEQGHPTEYDAIISDIAASKVNPDGSQNSELQAAWIQQNLQDERNSSAAERVQVTPASAKAGVTMFGNQALVQYGGNAPSGTRGVFAAGNPVALGEAQIVRWDGKEHEAMVCTVAVSIVQQGASGLYPQTGYNYRPYFRLLWGSSLAHPNELYGDIGGGVQFSITASFLYVNVGMDANPAATTAGSMALAGQMGFFAAGRPTSATRTQYADSLATGDANKKNFIIPLFAVGLLPIQCNERNTGACLVDWKDVAGTVICRSELLSPGSQVAMIPRPNDAYSIDLTNTGVATGTFRLMWALSL